MEGAFDAIRNLIDVEWLGLIRLLIVGCGRVGLTFLRLAIHHGINQIQLIEPDVVDPRNFASGFPEKSVGMWKAAYVRAELKGRRSDVQVKVSRATLTVNRLDAFRAGLAWCTHVAFFIDNFAVVSHMVNLAYSVKPCLYAGLLDTGRVGEAAWTSPAQTPCLSCLVRLLEKQGAHGGQTLLADVEATVNVAFRQFLGLALIGHRGFELFQPFVDPRRPLAYVISAAGGFLSMPDPSTPCGVRLVEVVDEHGMGPSCPTCQGYRP